MVAWMEVIREGPEAGQESVIQDFLRNRHRQRRKSPRAPRSRANPHSICTTKAVGRPSACQEASFHTWTDLRLTQVQERTLREKIIFAPTETSRWTPGPFTKLDLLLCRNVLIYFDNRTANAKLGSPLFPLQACARKTGLLILGQRAERRWRSARELFHSASPVQVAPCFQDGWRHFSGAAGPFVEFPSAFRTAVLPPPNRSIRGKVAPPARRIQSPKPAKPGRNKRPCPPSAIRLPAVVG